MHRSQCSRHGLSSNMMALSTSDCGEMQVVIPGMVLGQPTLKRQDGGGLSGLVKFLSEAISGESSVV